MIFPGGSDGKESTCNTGDLGSIPGLGISPGGENGNPLQYSCLENLHGQLNLAGYSLCGCKESDMPERLSTAHTPFQTIKSELWSKATRYIMQLQWWLRRYSICLQSGRLGFSPWVWKISWTRKWQPTPVFSPGKSHGRRSLVGYSPWGHKELDTTEWLHFTSLNEKLLLFSIKHNPGDRNIHIYFFL